MATDYTILGKFRNKEKIDYLVSEIRKRGYSCYNFCDISANIENPNDDPETQMQKHENTKDFWDDEYFHNIFKKDLQALREAEKVIVLLPAGNAVHIEMGIAYALNKPLILIGEVEKPETLYLIFKERYNSVEEFLSKLNKLKK